MIDEQELREILQRRASTTLATQPLDSAIAVRRGRRRQFLTGSVSLLVAVGLAIGAFSGIRTLQSRRTPMVEPSPTPATDAERLGFLSLAPEGSEASLPARGDLVISFEYFCCPGRSMYVYADGRMIWSEFNVVEPGKEGYFPLPPQGANDSETGRLEQRLTPEGVEMLRSELLSSGLFEEDHSFVKKTEELTIGVLRDGQIITLHAAKADDPFGATPAEAREILRLTELLNAPEAWLPDEAWADPSIRAFVPSRYVVVIHFYSNGGRTPDDPSELPAPADELLRSADVVDDSSACQVVTTSEARRINTGLLDAFGPDLLIPRGFMGTPVTIRSALPHQLNCAAAWG